MTKTTTKTKTAAKTKADTKPEGATETPVDTKSKTRPVEPKLEDVPSIKVRINAPMTGHFFATVAIPKRFPEVLIGPRGVRAYRVRDLGEHNSIYVLESFAELLDGQGALSGRQHVDMELRGPKTEAEKTTPGFWLHPAVADEVRELIPRVTIDEKPLQLVKTVDDGQSVVQNRFRAEFENGEYGVVLWLDIRARSPIVPVEAIVFTKDRQHRGFNRLERDPNPVLKMQFGEPVALGDGVVDASGLLGRSVPLDTASVGWLSASLLCQSRTIRNEDSDEVPLDEATRAAIDAGSIGPFFGQPHRWPSDWMLDGVPVLEQIQPSEEFVLGAKSTLEFASLPVHVSDQHPHNPGTQNSFGVSYFLHLLGDAKPELAEKLLLNAQDWFDRPVHFMEPGTLAEPIRPRARLRTKSRRPFTGRGNDFDLIELEQTPGTSVIRRRKGHDDQHFADMPLLAAYAMTGNPAIEWCMRSHLGMDLHQIQNALDSSGNGRAEGRVGINMLVSGYMLGGEDLERIIEHLRKRRDAALLQQERQEGPLGVEDDPRTHSETPAYTPYEEAQAAYAFWKAGKVTGDDEFNTAALRASELVVDALFFEDDRPWVPYRVTIGASPEELSLGSSKVHPGEWIHWSAPAFAVFKALAPSGDPRLEKVERAIEWLKTQPIRRMSDLHLAGAVL